MSDEENLSASIHNCRFRTATLEDLEALVALVNAAFVVEQIAIEGDRVDHAKVREYMRAGKFLVFESDAGVCGCVYVEKRGDRGYLGLLSVAPTKQNRGIGSKLTEAAEKFLREAGCQAVDLRVISARAELLSFYGKLGYSPTGTSPMPPDAPLKISCHFIHMSKSLS